MNEKLHSTSNSQYFSGRIDSLLEEPLTPENITSYADTALDGIVHVVDEYTNAYLSSPTIMGRSRSESEIYAARYYGIKDVDEILEHLSSRSEQIRAISEFIGGIATRKDIIIPTSNHFEGLNRSDGSFTQEAVIDRLKTALFILEADYNVALRSPDEITITRGEIPSGVFRKESYYALELHKLDRTILVCDQESNISFVFDSAALAAQGYTPKMLLDMTKPELRNLIKTNQTVGKTIRYSDNFVSDMVQAIKDPTSKASRKPATPKTSYLRLEKEDNRMTVTSFARFLGISPTTAHKTLGTISADVGEGIQSSRGLVYDPWQLNTLHDALLRRGALAQEAPEDWYTLKGISDLLGGFSTPRIKKLIGEINPDDDNSGIFKSNNGTGVPARHFSPVIIEQVRSRLSEEKRLARQSPDGYISKRELVKELGAGVLGVIDELGDTLGAIDDYRFGSQVTEGFSPEQYSMIVANTNRVHVAPDGYLTAGEITNMFELDYNTVRSAISKLREILGETEEYIKENAPCPREHFSPDQVNILKNYFEQRGTLVVLIPEDFRTMKNMVSEWGVTKHRLSKAIKLAGFVSSDMPRFRERLGQGSRPVIGFSPDQQNMIKSFIDNLQ